MLPPFVGAFMLQFAGVLKFPPVAEFQLQVTCACALKAPITSASIAARTGQNKPIMRDLTAIKKA
jgi:hypothetical protein